MLDDVDSKQGAVAVAEERPLAPPRRTRRLTVGQALIRFLIAQECSRDGAEPHRFFAGAFGIFGHGNLAGVGQALLEYQHDFRYYQARNEQAMVHMATGFAKMRNRLATLACTSSIGPGATNMVTGAAVATVNRLPVLLLPGDIFARRLVAPVLQQLESPWSQDMSVNDAFKSVSRYWDRIYRPEQLVSALFEAMRVLTSPGDTGAVTLALPQDVQAEAVDWPEELFRDRVWEIARPQPDRRALEHAVAAVGPAERPIVIAGGGVIYSEATAELRAFVESTGIPVAETQAGKGSLPFDHPLCLGAIGASGSSWANRVANDADLVIGIGTRYTDFTTASKTLFRSEDVRFVNLNVAELDAFKLAGLALTADAREGLRQLGASLSGYSVSTEYRQEVERAASSWRDEVDEQIRLSDDRLPTQAEVIGVVNASCGSRDVVVCAAGSLPGDLHRLWRSTDPKGYHMEYGYSCMGYEVAGAVGAKLADPSRTVIAMVGDGSWLMLSQDLLTAIQERQQLIVVLVDNQGYGSIAALSEASGSQAFGTRFRYRDETGALSGDSLPIDLSANARSLGAATIDVDSATGLRDALAAARESGETTVIHVLVNPQGRFGGSGAWWDVPVAEVSELESTQHAREAYERELQNQRNYL
jgi:3D-(3,5/4)-trihydroxycyclohexane-1,2-dione acylhydrolase (decyclizing)